MKTHIIVVVDDQLHHFPQLQRNYIDARVRHGAVNVQCPTAACLCQQGLALWCCLQLPDGKRDVVEVVQHDGCMREANDSTVT